MRDQELVNALRIHLEVVRKIGLYPDNSGICAVIEQASDRIANQSTHIAALQQEIEKLRGQVPRWIPVDERLPKTESWGASKVVLGIVQNESGYPPPNPCFCVYLGNQKWRIRGRMATITHWMPLPTDPEAENAENK